MTITPSTGSVTCQVAPGLSVSYITALNLIEVRRMEQVIVTSIVPRGYELRKFAWYCQQVRKYYSN